MSNDVKTYQIYNFDIRARSLEEAVEKIKIILDTDPDSMVKEVDLNKWKVHKVNQLRYNNYEPNSDSLVPYR